jgi:hypothetical protein
MLALAHHLEGEREILASVWLNHARQTAMKNDEGHPEAERVCARETCDERKHGHRDPTQSIHGHHARSPKWIKAILQSKRHRGLQFSIAPTAYNKDVTFVIVNVCVTDVG